ncbi:DUF1513 domain-containing protein [Microvirga sp. 17 mud 1-3]|uniref:DUF1513 domain-containing protein n=1 Tax=Microvirga sp. 17 mud 1-3 TaxID=2082949 RepID=UPI0013A57B7C|nr:DUF1513 domain-containing protein [Microvirga sp. 17 mud 1-3]
MTAIDRRSFLGALGAAVAGTFYPGQGFTAEGRPLFVSACFAEDGKNAAVAVFSLDGEMLFNTRLPERGHDIAIRPGAADLVVFARRPGNWAAIIDRVTGTVRRVVTSPEGRHFYGHGVFSADGGLLYATENSVATGEGLLGIYDAAGDYRRVGEMPSFGIGPHDLAYLPGHRHIVVANGGIRTNPETGREILNKDRMEPSLAIVDPAGGSVLLKVDLGPDLRGLSIRHLAVSPRGETVFGCQFEGDETGMPALVGTLTPDGRTRFLEMPEDALDSMRNYVGSVALDASGRIAVATSPIGNMMAFWDLESGRFLGRRRMSDVCGVAPTPSEGIFLATSGNAGVRLAPVGQNDLKPLGGTELGRWVWDNHVRRV